MSKWLKVYTSFNPTEICFTHRKKVIKFMLDGLDCQKISELELEFRYKNIRKLRIRFENPQSTKNMNAKIKHMIQ